MRPVPPPALRRFVHLTLVFVAGLGLLLGIWMALIHLREDPLVDVRAYYDAASRLNSGLPLYAQEATTNDAEFYRYPPLLAILFRPLALLPFEAAALIWEGVVVASFLAILWRMGLSSRTWMVVGLLGVPIGWTIMIGQAHVPMTLLMLLGSPLTIALAANLKILPALMAVWWVGRRDWRSLRRFVGWCLALALLQLVLEPAGTLAFPSVFNLQQVGEVKNMSPYAISPVLWLGLVIAGGLLCLRLAPTRYGWAVAVAFSVLATPRLHAYQLMALLAAARSPEERDEGDRRA